MRYWLVLLFFQFIIIGAAAQDSSPVNINDLISSVNTFSDSLGIEKLYLQTDKPSYLSGDTLWFKAYLFDASTFNGSTKSGILYVEIANDSNRVVTRIMLPVFNGLAAGQIALNEQEIPQGGYTLRAYTNWMRNFGEDYIVKKPIYIGNASDQDWLINYSIQPSAHKLQLSLELDRIDKSPIGLRELQVQIADKNKAWFKNDLETNIDGLLTIDFELPEQADSKNLTLNLQDLRKNEGNRKLSIPISLNRPELIDLQFMPEGGNLVAGLPAHVAFKAINEDGLGTDVAGKIYNSKLQEVAEFQSTHRGIGTFDFTPLDNETYSARIELPDGSFNSYNLPTAKSTGISMAINNTFQSDSCEIIIQATPDISAGTYSLIGQSRGKALYGANFVLGKDPLRLMINKDIFPSGLTKFTLIGAGNNVLNERIVFIDHDDNLRIQLISNKASYQLRDSVALDIEVTDKNGMPVQGSFSLAVTDDGQVKIDSLTYSSIISQMLLTADLKGTVEDPGYYSQPATDAKKWQDLDQLLLAQGWVAYDWGKVFKGGQTFAYAAQPEFLIKGKVTNMFNKPVANSGIVLLSKNPFLTADTITNEQGLFTFKDIIPIDTAIFFIQSRNKNGKSSNVGIEMEEFKPPSFAPMRKRMAPWYVNTDTVKLLSINKQIQLEKDQEKASPGTLLKAVVIEGRKVIKDSKNLNGPGGSDIALNEEDLEKAGKRTLGDLLYKNIPGFMLKHRGSFKFYYVDTRLAHFIIDGVDMETVRPPSELWEDYYKNILDSYSAEDIKGIEVMLSGKNQLGYDRFLPPSQSFYDHVWIEITTRSGTPFLTNTPGTYLYKPMSFSASKQFYSPKYKQGSIADITDIRSTIFWEPFIITNKDGKATLSFYTADNPGSYSIIIEGSDMQGNIGSKRTKIMVEK